MEPILTVVQADGQPETVLIRQGTPRRLAVELLRPVVPAPEHWAVAHTLDLDPPGGA